MTTAEFVEYDSKRAIGKQKMAAGVRRTPVARQRCERARRKRAKTATFRIWNAAIFPPEPGKTPPTPPAGGNRGKTRETAPACDCLCLPCEIRSDSKWIQKFGLCSEFWKFENFVLVRVLRVIFVLSMWVFLLLRRNYDFGFAVGSYNFVFVLGKKSIFII